MKTSLRFYQFSKKVVKIFLSLFFINLLILFIVFFAESCNKTEMYYDNGEAKNKFLSSLNEYKVNINSIKIINHIQSNSNFIKSNSTSGNTLNSNSISTENNIITAYLQFPVEPSPSPTLIQEVNTIQQLSEIIHSNNAILQYESSVTNIMYPIDIPLDGVTSQLQPLIYESKQYLYSKGLTEQDIQQMIMEDSAQEVDLIPFVMGLTQIENVPIASINYSHILFNKSFARSISWHDVGSCAINGIIGDLGLVMGSSAVTTSWSVLAIKSAFKTVAKRALGPVGVAIAVAEFGLCLSQIALE
jgi:hypothetical protein